MWRDAVGFGLARPGAVRHVAARPGMVGSGEAGNLMEVFLWRGKTRWPSKRNTALLGHLDRRAVEKRHG